MTNTTQKEKDRLLLITLKNNLRFKGIYDIALIKKRIKEIEQRQENERQDKSRQDFQARTNETQTETSQNTQKEISQHLKKTNSLLEIRGILRTLTEDKGQSISKPKRLLELIEFLKSL